MNDQEITEIMEIVNKAYLELSQIAEADNEHETVLKNRNNSLLAQRDGHLERLEAFERDNRRLRAEIMKLRELGWRR